MRGLSVGGNSFNICPIYQYKHWEESDNSYDFNSLTYMVYLMFYTNPFYTFTLHFAMVICIFV